MWIVLSFFAGLAIGIMTIALLVMAKQSERDWEAFQKRSCMLDD